MPRKSVGLKKNRKTAARLKALERLLKSKRPKSALEIAAIQRQMRDLDEGHKRGLVWDEESAQRAVAFFPLLQHVKGPFAGKPFVLEPWQEHCLIAPLYGWKRETGLRRFRTAYWEFPRKQGKTFLCAGVGLKALCADGEAGAEVYAGATTRDQACRVFNDAKQAAGRQLRRVLQMYQWSITFDLTNSIFKPLSSDHDNLDGLNVSCAILDELHAHKSRGLWDVIQTATGARTQPLIVAITTAGDDEKSLCAEVRKTAVDVLEGAPDYNDSFFGFITCAEEGDDWLSPETWWKANPNYGVSIDKETLADIARQARVSKASENNFRRKHLNQWITGVSEWIAPAVWASCKRKDWPDLTGREMFSAIDIGWRDDFAALGRVFPERIQVAASSNADKEEPETGAGATARGPKSKIRRAFVDVKLWIPREGRRDIHAPPLVNWIARGLVTLTPGRTTDIGAIVRQVMADAERYQLRSIGIDPNNARQLGNDLEGLGIPRFEFRQNKWNYHEPCMELATLVASGDLFHPDHEILNWMIKNVRLESNSAGYVMPCKAKSTEKIDGAVAVLMALGLAMFTEIAPQSIYNEEGVGVL